MLLVTYNLLPGFLLMLMVISMEGPVGLEPTTPCLKGRCSNRLSYGPAFGIWPANNSLYYRYSS
jgi:hypothetical protein